MLAARDSSKPQTSKGLEKPRNEAAVEEASKLSARPLGARDDSARSRSATDEGSSSTNQMYWCIDSFSTCPDLSRAGAR